MKKLVFGAILLLPISRVFAQTPRRIEVDLLKSFKKIGYWDMHRTNDDSLPAANKQFAGKLVHYINKYPASISWPFNSLVKNHVAISSSAGGLFRIYSWDTQLGGTMHRYGNLIQYRGTQGVRSDLFVYDEKDFGTFYRKIVDVRAGRKVYYLCFSFSVLSGADYVDAVNVMTIDKGKLKKDVKLIKTEKGLVDALYAEYDLSATVNRDIKNNPKLSFNKKSQTIHMPLILENQKVTGKYIDYKFNGQYFVKLID